MDLKKLLNRKAFLTKLAFKLGIEKSSLENYFITNRFSEKHKERISKAYKLQLEFDDKVRNMEVEVWKDI